MSTLALLIVQADIPNEADRAPFDDWYDRHMPDAVRAFGALHAWRAWSRTNPSKHTAFYEFSSLEAANAAMRSPGQEFDVTWGSRATRTRDVLEVVQRAPVSDWAGPFKLGNRTFSPRQSSWSASI